MQELIKPPINNRLSIERRRSGRALGIGVEDSCEYGTGQTNMIYSKLMDRSISCKISRSIRHLFTAVFNKIINEIHDTKFYDILHSEKFILFNIPLL